jgi:hypothetical protein
MIVTPEKVVYRPGIREDICQLELARQMADPPPRVNLHDLEGTYQKITQTQRFREVIYDPAFNYLLTPHTPEELARLKKIIKARLFREICFLTAQNTMDHLLVLPPEPTLAVFSSYFPYEDVQYKTDILGPYGLEGIPDPHGLAVRDSQAGQGIALKDYYRYKYEITPEKAWEHIQEVTTKDSSHRTKMARRLKYTRYHIYTVNQEPLPRFIGPKESPVRVLHHPLPLNHSILDRMAKRIYQDYSPDGEDLATLADTASRLTYQDRYSLGDEIYKFYEKRDLVDSN